MKKLAQKQVSFSVKFSQVGCQQAIVTWVCIVIMFFNQLQLLHIAGVIQKTHDFPITDRVY